ncbi:MAG: hypothetical protein J3K34DRAFT_479331 [Monoraphidium minutum]|nr:MAG: hypothetical protein J3K34DRAFT_479331 [Monoraphidium minutum]
MKLYRPLLVAALLCALALGAARADDEPLLADADLEGIDDLGAAAVPSNTPQQKILTNKEFPGTPADRPPMWAFRTYADARGVSCTTNENGVLFMEVQHKALKGVTPEMMGWLYENLDGKSTHPVNKKVYANFLLAHPRDHVKYVASGHPLTGKDVTTTWIELPLTGCKQQSDAKAPFGACPTGPAAHNPGVTRSTPAAVWQALTQTNGSMIVGEFEGKKGVEFRVKGCNAKGTCANVVRTSHNWFRLQAPAGLEVTTKVQVGLDMGLARRSINPRVVNTWRNGEPALQKCWRNALHTIEVAAVRRGGAAASAGGSGGGGEAADGGSKRSGGGGGGGGAGAWERVFGSADVAQRRIRLYVTALLAAAVPLMGWYLVTRLALASSAQLLTSSHPDLAAAGARRARLSIWTDATAAHAVELRLDELLAAAVRPGAPPGLMSDALSALEALAGFDSGRAALAAGGLPAVLNAGLRDGWLAGGLVGRARALRDELDPRGAGEEGGGGGRWRRARDAGAGEGAPASDRHESPAIKLSARSDGGRGPRARASDPGDHGASPRSYPACEGLPAAPDAVCTISIAPHPRPGLGGKLAATLRLGAALERGAGGAFPPRARAGPPPALADLPDSAAELIWAHLDDADRRAARLAGLFACAVRRAVLRPGDLAAAAGLAARLPALSELTLRLGAPPPPAPCHGRASADGSAADAAPEPEQLHAQIYAFAAGAAAAGGLRHLHTLDVDGRLRGAPLAALARLAAAAPNVKRLRLPGLRLSAGAGAGRASDGASSRRASDGGGGRRASGGCGTPAAVDAGAGRDERYLCGVLDALQGLVELHLGSPVGSAAGGSGTGGVGGGGGAPLPLAVLRRIARLRRLEALSADASGPRDARCAAALLRSLPLLRRLALRVADGAGSPGGGAALAGALCGLTRLEQLEIDSPDLGEEFAAALQPGRLARLQVLSLGFCPRLPPSAARQIAALPALTRLTLPFALDADALHHLARLPALTELYTWSSVSLAGAAPPPGGGGEPLSILGRAPVALAAVTKLVAASVRAAGSGGGGGGAPRGELAAVFPALRSLALRRGGDQGLALAAGLGPRLEALALHSAPRAGDGALALLAGCRGLARLKIEDAPALTDAGFEALFSVPAPALTSLSLHGLPGLSDAGMLPAAAACRRLAALSVARCPALTDRTLSRLGHLERLTAAQLVRLGRGVTASGVAALAAAPAMASVVVAGCAGVLPAGCREHRRGVRVRVDDVEV